MTLWNFPQSVMLSTKGKYVVAILPHGVKASEVIDKLIIQPCIKLESGYNFSVAIQDQVLTEKCYGTLIGLGDHMGHIDLAGIVGPKGERPSIYSLTQRSTMNIITKYP